MTESAVILDTGPFRVAVRSSEKQLLETLAFFYRDSLCAEPDPVFDFDVRLARPRSLRRWLRSQVVFEVDGARPFEPQPLENAFPVYEWGLNWCIATSAHRYLMLHAGSVAFGDRALILPGTPGSGKSTLSAALQLRGARLLSDEFGIIRPERGDLLPMPRGIPLKNASIEAIIAFDAAAPLGPTYPKTRKGRVRHLRPSDESQAQRAQPAQPHWLVFPRYEAGSDTVLQPLARDDAFRELAFNCFNYKLLGLTAFRALSELAGRVDSYTLRFSDLEHATARLARLADDAGTPNGVLDESTD